jgi:hypothetical protein
MMEKYFYRPDGLQTNEPEVRRIFFVLIPFKYI